MTSPQTIIELPTKSYVDSLHESSRNRRDLSSVFIDQDNEFDNNKLPNLGSITVNRNPNLDNELANKKYIDDELDKNTVFRFNQTLENYLKVSVGNDTYNLTEYDKIQIRDTTNIKYPNTRGYLLQNCVKKCNDKNNNGKKTKLYIFIKQQKQILQPVIREQSHYLLLVKVLCILRHHLIIMVITSSSASNEQIIFKLVI